MEVFAKAAPRMARAIAALLIAVILGASLAPAAFATGGSDEQDAELIPVIRMQEGGDEVSSQGNEPSSELPVLDPEVQKTYEETGSSLAEGADKLAPGAAGGEWAVIGLARSSQDLEEGWEDPYLARAATYVQQKANEKEQLHVFKSTENSRLVIALTSLGVDPSDFAGHNLLMGLTDMEYLKKQGINGPIWALIAFDSGNYEIPKAPEGAVQVTRDSLVDAILAAQLEDGGWALSGEVSDPDMTGMALQALAPYKGSDPCVAAAVDEAVDHLSRTQADDGGYSSYGSPTAESAAQVIVALTALGIDPDTDNRFIAASKSSLLDALLSYAVDGGGFSHVQGGSLNGMATEQAYYALVAYERLKAELSSLFDMSDVAGREDEVPSAGDDGLSGPEDGGDSPEADSDAAEKKEPVASGATVSVGVAVTEKAKKLAEEAEDGDFGEPYTVSLSESAAAEHQGLAAEEGSFPREWAVMGGAALVAFAVLGAVRFVTSRREA